MGLGPSCPRSGAGLLVVGLGPAPAGFRAEVVLGLVSAHWWVRLVLRLEQACFWAGAGACPVVCEAGPEASGSFLLVGGVGSWNLCL